MAITVNQPITITANKPLDSRQIINSIYEYKNIRNPYVGMLFYSISENDWYIVLSLAPGFLVYDTGQVVSSVPEGTLYKDYEVIENSFINEFKLFVDELSKGEQGKPGEKGDPGKSAYEIAQELGYKGSKEQWLLSLKGADGNNMKPITREQIIEIFESATE